MAGFRFPLEMVLRWRHMQLELDKARFRRQAAEPANVDRALADGLGHRRGSGTARAKKS